MRNKILFTITLFVAIVCKNYAQPWTLTGNANATAVSSLGSTAAGIPLRLVAGGTEWMRILANGNIGIHTTVPNFPLHIIGDGGNRITSSGWLPALHLQNHAAIVFDNDGIPNARYLIMGHPSFNVDRSFYCGLATNLAFTPNTPNVGYVYRIVDIPAAGTPPNSGDFEFFNTPALPHNVLADGSLGIGLDAGVSALYRPGNRVEINTTAPQTVPATIAPSAVTGAATANGNGGTGFSGLRFTDLRASSNVCTANFSPGKVLTVDNNGDVIIAPGATNANNGTGMSTVNPGTVVLGQNVCQAGNPSALTSNREIPYSGFYINHVYLPDNFASGKVGFGMPLCNAGVNGLRPSNVTMQVNGSISLFDGTGNTSLFFGENTVVPGANNFGQWGIHYDDAPAGNTGLNFWRPFGSGGYGFGNRFLFLCDNGNVGIGATNANTPANALEIKSYPNSPRPAGLRFTNLTSASAPLASPPTNNVLSVDQNGDVVLIQPKTIGTCNTGPSTFPANDHGAIDLGANNNNFYFDGQGGLNTTDVGIGVSCNSFLPAKLKVDNTGGSSANVYAVWGTATGSSNENVAINGEALGTAASINIGGRFASAKATFTNYGVWADAVGTAPQSIGILAQAGKATNNFGIIASGLGPGSPSLSGSWAGVFNGDVYCTANATFPTWSSISDSVLKKNVSPFSSGLAVMRNISPRSYHYNGKANLDTTRTYLALSPKI